MERTQKKHASELVFFDTETVLEVVDACFHAYASSYRTAARKTAQDICAKLLNKRQQCKGGIK